MHSGKDIWNIINGGVLHSDRFSASIVYIHMPSVWHESRTKSYSIACQILNVIMPNYPALWWYKDSMIHDFLESILLGLDLQCLPPKDVSSRNPQLILNKKENFPKTIRNHLCKFSFRKYWKFALHQTREINTNDCCRCCELINKYIVVNFTETSAELHPNNQSHLELDWWRDT